MKGLLFLLWWNAWESQIKAEEWAQESAGQIEYGNELIHINCTWTELTDFPCLCVSIVT